MKLFLFMFIFFSFFTLKSEVKLKAITPEERDLGCITLLTLASEKSKKDGEMVKYEKLKKLQKSYLGKYEDAEPLLKSLYKTTDEKMLSKDEKMKTYGV